MDILDLARRNQQKAWKIIEDTKIIPAWESVGARVNLVGSLNTGLLMKHLDIDFHIYTPQFSLSDSFQAMVKLTENKSFMKICWILRRNVWSGMPGIGMRIMSFGRLI